jgi:hypothetical protein
VQQRSRGQYGANRERNICQVPGKCTTDEQDVSRTTAFRQFDGLSQSAHGRQTGCPSPAALETPNAALAQSSPFGQFLLGEQASARKRLPHHRLS